MKTGRNNQTYLTRGDDTFYFRRIEPDNYNSISSYQAIVDAMNLVCTKVNNASLAHVIVEPAIINNNIQKQQWSI